MPVFDFSDTPVANEHPECTYETFHSTETKASADKPIVVIDNKQKEWAHHALGMFTNPIKRTSFEFEDGDGVTSADILRIDSRFVSLFKWLGENHIKVQLSGANTPDGYAVYRVREVALGRGTKLSAEDGFLQYMMERLFASTMPEDEPDLDDYEEEGDSMKLTSIQSITDFMTCAGRTLPDNILLWARRNLAVARSSEVSPEERRHVFMHQSSAAVIKGQYLVVRDTLFCGPHTAHLGKPHAMAGIGGFLCAGRRVPRIRLVRIVGIVPAPNLSAAFAGAAI